MVGGQCVEQVAQRLPPRLDVQVPVATYTGWALRRAPFAANEDCALTGQYIPFKATLAERLAAGDPRPSVKERYPNHGVYVSKVVRATQDTARQRYLLQEDVSQIINRAAASSIGN